MAGTEQLVYLRVRAELERQILDGTFGAGELVPSTTSVARAKSVNPATVQRAYSGMVADGILNKRRGVGMEVASDAVENLRSRLADDLLERRIPQLRRDATLLGIHLDVTID